MDFDTSIPSTTSPTANQFDFPPGLHPKFQTVDGHNWMRRLHVPAYWIAKLRRMRVGTTLWVGFIEEAAIAGSTGRCAAGFRRVRGGWTFEAISSLQMPARRKERELIEAKGTFTLKKNDITFDPETTQTDLQRFRLICGYISHLSRHAKSYGIDVWEDMRARYTQPHRFLRGEYVTKRGRSWRSRTAPHHCHEAEDARPPLPPEMLTDLSEGKGRKNLFGRPEMAYVYRKARDFIVENKIFRLCQLTNTEGVTSLTICNLWRIDRHPDKSIRTYEYSLVESKWNEVTTLDWWPDVPLYPIVKTQSLDWWRALASRAIWKTLIAAGYDHLKHCAPYSDTGKLMQPQTMVNILMQRYLGFNVGTTKKGKPKYKQGVLTHKSMIAGARALRSAIFREFLDGEILSVMRAIEYDRIIELRSYLNMARDQEALLRVARERRNLIPLLLHIDRHHWNRTDLFSHKLWVRGGRKRTMVDYKTFVEKAVAWSRPTPFTSFSSKAAFRWLSNAPITVVKSWSDQSGGRKNITVLENISQSNINHKIPVIAWRDLVSHRQSVEALGVGAPVQRLYRLYAAHCEAIWKDHGFKAVKEWLKGGTRIGDIADWLAAEGLAQGMPTRNTTWAALLRHSNDWHERVAVANYDNGSTRNETWESLVSVVEIDGVAAMPLNSCRELALEGYRQHHCVGDYMERCIQGTYRVYTVVEPDSTRTTLGIWKNKHGNWQMDQHRGKYNDPISSAAANAGRIVLERYKMLQAAPAGSPPAATSR